MKLFAPLLALALTAPISAFANNNWKVLIDGANGTLWFVRNVRQYGNLTFVDVKTEEDPNGDNGEKYAFIYAFDCRKQTYQDTEQNKMMPVEMDMIEGDIYKFSCKK